MNLPVLFVFSHFPPLAPVDLHWYHICTHLSTTAPDCASGSHADAYATNLALWYTSAVMQGRSEVAVYVKEAMAACIAKKRSVHSTAWQSSVMDSNSTRGSFFVEAVLAANRVVLISRSLNVMFERTLNEILALSKELQPTVRAKVIRVLNPLLQSDNDLIQRDNIRTVITSRLNDRAISVREESVKLLSQYVIRGYQGLADEYLEGLQKLLHDEGISVRKSVVMLFKEILLNQPAHPQYISLCQALLEKMSHPKEEESIKEIIRLTFQQIWFLPPSNAQVKTGQRLRLAASTSLGGTFSESCGSLSNKVARNSLESTPTTPALREVPSASSLTRTFSFQDIPANDTSPLEQSTLALSQSPQRAKRNADSALLPLSRASSESNVATPKAHSPRGLPISALSHASSVDCNTASSSPRGANPLTSPKVALQDHIRAISLQMVDLAAMEQAGDWMVSLLRELLHGAAEGDDTTARLQQRRGASFRHCEQIVSSLIDLLLCTEEQQPEMMRLLELRHKDSRTQAANIIRTIALFVQAHPPFIARHLATLLPYLKQDNGYTREQNALIKLKVTDILTSAACLDSTNFSFNLSEVISDLKKCALNQTGKNIKAAVNCLTVLIKNVTHDASPLFQLADTCFRSIKSVATAVPDSTKLTAATLGNLKRCFIVFGYICECARNCSTALREYGQLFSERCSSLSASMRRICSSAEADKTIALTPDISEIELLHPAALYGTCYVAAVYALTLPEPTVQMQGAQALCGVFTGCP